MIPKIKLLVFVLFLNAIAHSQEYRATTSATLKGSFYLEYVGKTGDKNLFHCNSLTAGKKLFLINDDLSAYASREIAKVDEIEKCQFYGIHEIGSDFYLFYGGLSKNSAEKYALYVSKISPEVDQSGVTQVVEFSWKSPDSKFLKVVVSENKDYLGVVFINERLDDSYEYDAFILNSSFVQIQQFTNISGEFTQSEKLRSCFITNGGDLYCLFDDSVNKKENLGGYAPIGSAIIHHYLSDGEIMNYEIPFEEKNCIGLEFTSDQSPSGGMILNLFWFSPENNSVTGWTKYELSTNNETILQTFDPIFAKPFRNHGATRVEEGEEAGTGSCHFFMREKWNKKVGNDKLVLLEKHSRHNSSDGIKTCSGSLLIYRFDQDGNVIWQNSINRFMEGSGGTFATRLVGSKLYILFYDRIENAGTGNDNIIYCNRDMPGQWAVFLATINIENNEKTITNLETNAVGFNQGAFLVMPGSFAFEGDNALLVAKGGKLIKIVF